MHRSSVVFCAVLAAALAGEWAGPTRVFGQPATQPSAATIEGHEEASEIRIYDVSDLVGAVRDYPAVTGAVTNGTPPSPPEAGGVSTEALKQSLQDLVASDTWKENGGMIGAIVEMKLPNLSLLVTQTPKNHEAIAHVLKLLREQRAIRTMVCTRAYWLLLEPGEAQAAFDAANPGEGSTMPIVSDAMLAKAKLYCQGQTMCFSGQTVAIQSHRQQGIVSDVTPIVGTQAVGYDPEISVAESGATLQITPQLASNGEGVLLDLHSTVLQNNAKAKRLDAPTSNPTDGAADATPAIDLQDAVRQAFATTVRLPLGKRVLVSGMTLEPNAGDGSGRQLYLAIEVTAVR